MKTEIVLIAALFVLMNIRPPLHGQQFTANKVFVDSAGSAQAYVIVKTDDHHYLIAGSKDSSGLVVKMDSACSILWSKKYEYPGGVSFSSITATNDNCFVLTSQFYNTIKLRYNILLIKINSDGDTLWSKEIDLGHTAYPGSVQLINDGGFILAGYVGQIPYPWSKDFVIRLDSVGNLVWYGIYAGSNDMIDAFTVRQMPDHGFIVSGYLENSPSNQWEPYVLKLTSAGAVEWSKKLSIGSFCFDVAVTPGGLLWYIYTGYTVIVKTDFIGNSISGKIFPGLVAWNDLGPRQKLHPISDGGYIGILNSGPYGGWLFKIDSSGNLFWTQSLVMRARDVVESDDKGFMIIGNGPVWLDKFEQTPPHIGVNKTDSLGNCPGYCVFPYTVDTSSFLPVLVPVTFTSETAGITINTIHPQVSSTPLVSYDGCVTLSTGIMENKADNNHLSIFPNPSTGIIRMKINLPDLGEMKCVEIFDFFGKMVYRTTDLVVLKSPVDLSSLGDGIYTIRAMSRDKIFTEKIIICR